MRLLTAQLMNRKEGKEMKKADDKFTKKDWIGLAWYVIFVLVFFLLILGPKFYWLPGGGFILQ